jgi:peptidoglycan hydrolase-like protein with peptidoglycan-binding domain
MAIDPARAREIQIALIREKYMQGEPTGTWDAATQAAMQRYQADHGWQSKTTPDARALIKLGLGPSHDRLLNPDSAMTSTSSSTTTASTKIPIAPVAAETKTRANPTTPDNDLPKN